jgi:hypothetical protein
MASRRHFLRHCLASSAGLVWASRIWAGDKAEAKKPEPVVTPAAQKAIASGLKYLKEQQHKDGSFGTAAFVGNVGITSLCGLAMLSAGHRPGAGAFGQVLDSALDYVVGQEDPKQRGFLFNPKASPHGPMYNHGFAVLLLARAHGHVADKKQAANLTAVLGRAVGLTVASQNAEKGWRYRPESKDSDLTVTAGQVCALRAAQDVGIKMPKEVLEGAADYVKKCQNPDGGFRYMVHGPAGVSSYARTAAGLLALYSAGVTRGQEVERGLALLLKSRPDAKVPRPDMHYYFGHYHAALATWAAGGNARKEWYPATRDELVGRQGEDGSWKDQICAHYATAMALIVLQAPNGFLSPKF